jgi:hypothetical protein
MKEGNQAYRERFTGCPVREKVFTWYVSLHEHANEE